MRILFAADMSLNFIPAIEDRAAVEAIMGDTAQVFRSSDFSVVNQENIFGSEDAYSPIVKSGPNLISDPSTAAFLDVLAPTVVGFANNHTGDFGPEAMFDTMAMIRERGMLPIGAGANLEEAYQPAILEKDGIKVAVIAVCENEFGTAGENTPGSAGYRLGMLTGAIRKARERGELPIVYFHGGNETNPFPSVGKVELYRHFVDLGAAAVIAMHTHCPQGYEMYDGCPIVYSMGNFFFPAKWDSIPTWSLGYMAMLDITAEGITLDTIPYRFDFEHHTLLTGQEKENFDAYLQELCTPIGDPCKLSRLFDAWTVIGGLNGYVRAVNYHPEMVAEGAESVKALKNVFSCEAHNELVKNTLKLIFEGRCADYQEEVDYIKRLQNVKI